MREDLETYIAIHNAGVLEHAMVTQENIYEERHAYRHYGLYTRRHIYKFSSQLSGKFPDIC
jgi:hypothetical protein